MDVVKRLSTEQRHDIWNKRLNECRLNYHRNDTSVSKRLSQEELANELNAWNAERGVVTHFTQTTIGRWLNIGRQRRSFPKYEHMQMLADFFGVPVGYLTGDIDGETYEESDVATYTGLDAKAVRALHEELTDPWEHEFLDNLPLSISKFIADANFTGDLAIALANYMDACRTPKADQPAQAVQLMLRHEEKVEYRRMEVWKAVGRILDQSFGHPKFSEASIDDYLTDIGKANKQAEEQRRRKDERQLYENTSASAGESPA